MRCLSCDARLTPFEASRRYKSSGEYMDLCNSCMSHVEDVETVVNKSLETNHNDSIDEEYDDANI